MTVTKASINELALSHAFKEAMEYGTDDTMAPSDIEKFVKLHIEDFNEMVADYVSERV